MIVLALSNLFLLFTLNVQRTYTNEALEGWKKSNDLVLKANGSTKSALHSYDEIFNLYCKTKEGRVLPDCSDRL